MRGFGQRSGGRPTALAPKRRTLAVLGAPPTAVLCLFGADLLMVALDLFAPPLPAWARGGPYRASVWDLGREGNVPTWYASFQLSLIGVVMLGLASVSVGRRRTRVALGLVGLIFVSLSLDEIAGLHERFAAFVRLVIVYSPEFALSRTGPWMLIVAPVFLVVLGLAAWAGRDLLRDRPAVQLLYAAGLTVYIASFAGFEAFQNFLPRPDDRYPTVLFEEAGELLGATLLAWATFELARSHGYRLTVDDATDGDGAAASV